MILYDVFSVSEETGGAGDRGRRWWLAKYCGRVVSGWPRESSNQLTGCRFRARATEKNTRNSVSIKRCKLLAVISTTKVFLLIFTRNFALLLEKFEFVLCLVVSKPFFVQCNLDHQFCRRSPHQTPCARVAHKDSTFALHRLLSGAAARGTTLLGCHPALDLSFSLFVAILVLADLSFIFCQRPQAVHCPTREKQEYWITPSTPILTTPSLYL